MSFFLKKVHATKNVNSNFKFFNNLQHPHIVKVYAIEKGSDGFYNFNLEKTHGKRLNLYQKNSKKILIQLIDSVYYMVDKELVHLDLKPSNILISNNNIKIIDIEYLNFYYVYDDPPIFNFTFSAPEVFQKKIHKYSDLYSLGILIGLVLMGTESIYLSRDNIKSELSNWLETNASTKSIHVLIKKLLSDNPQDRWIDSSEIKNEIDKLQISTLD
tara:strand:+ start:583 stop:1227 length:645 start_codon:yes stop_codon:yes gene_type:complete